jgi:hypothetical protein
MPDTDEASRKDMEQEATQELMRRYRHDLLLVAVRIVSPAESNVPIVAGDETMVRDGDAVGVSSQVAEDVFWAAEGWLGVDHPVSGEQSAQEAAEVFGRSDLLQRAVELKPVVPEELSECLSELPAEYAAECHDWQEEAVRTTYPPGTVRAQTTRGNDVMHMRVVFQALTPCMQHTQEADLGAKVPGIACHLEHRFGAGRIKQIIEDSLVAESNRGEFMGKGEYDVEVVNGQQLL